MRVLNLNNWRGNLQWFFHNCFWKHNKRTVSDYAKIGSMDLCSSWYQTLFNKLASWYVRVYVKRKSYTRIIRYRQSTMHYFPTTVVGHVVVVVIVFANCRYFAQIYERRARVVSECMGICVEYFFFKRSFKLFERFGNVIIDRPRFGYVNRERIAAKPFVRGGKTFELNSSQQLRALSWSGFEIKRFENRRYAFSTQSQYRLFYNRRRTMTIVRTNRITRCDSRARDNVLPVRNNDRLPATPPARLQPDPESRLRRILYDTLKTKQLHAQRDSTVNANGTRRHRVHTFFTRFNQPVGVDIFFFYKFAWVYEIHSSMLRFLGRNCTWLRKVWSKISSEETEPSRSQLTVHKT